MSSIKDAPGAAQELLETCHDMRQPVAGVLALAAAALAEPGLPEAARARLEHIVEEAEWLADMILYRLLGSARQEPGTCQADVGQVVRDAVAAEAVTWTGTLSVTEPAEPVLSAVHPVVLRGMVANLIGNAARAAGPDGTVKITVGHRRHRALVTVEDSGPGFGNIQRGLGLGLSAVARELSKLDGRMEFGRSALDGARVCLWLPRSTAETQPPTTQAGSRVTAGRAVPKST